MKNVCTVGHKGSTSMSVLRGEAGGGDGMVFLFVYVCVRDTHHLYVWSMCSYIFLQVHTCVFACMWLSILIVYLNQSAVLTWRHLLVSRLFLSSDLPDCHVQSQRDDEFTLVITYSVCISHTQGRKTHSNTYIHIKAVGTIATVFFLTISVWFFFMCLSIFFLCLSETECFLQDSKVLFTKTTHFISKKWKAHISLLFFFYPIPVTFAQHIPFWLCPQIPVAFQNSNHWEWICTFSQGDWRNAKLRFGKLTVCLSQRDH